MTLAGADGPREARSRRSAFAIATVLVLVASVLFGLGIWQIQRRAWKLDLIARVEQRVTAAPQPAPGPADWPSMTDGRDSYRRVEASGVLLTDRSVFAQAVTALGGGYWVMTPLRTDSGFDVFINRGYVPSGSKSLAFKAPSDSPVTIVGLLRMTEPHGGFLRTNDPGTDRWHSRDVAAMAAKRDLDNVAPYFIDAAAGLEANGPVGGLTIVSFTNNHLIYAITWFALAAMTLFAALLFTNRKS